MLTVRVSASTPQVKSLTLDRWTPSCAALLAALGNAKVRLPCALGTSAVDCSRVTHAPSRLAVSGRAQANAIWEANVMQGWVKPASTAPQPTIEKWIRTKYQWKGAC